MKLQDIRNKETIYLKRNFWGKEVVYHVGNTIEVKYNDKWYPIETVKEYNHMNLEG